MYMKFKKQRAVQHEWLPINEDRGKNINDIYVFAYI